MNLLAVICAGILFLQGQGYISTFSQKAPPPSDTILYTALGDSLAFGIFAPWGDGYVSSYKKFVWDRLGKDVNLFNLGVPGWKSDDLLNALEDKILLRYIISRSSVITLNIGGNDVLTARKLYKKKDCGGGDNQDCLRATLESLKKNWDGILTELISLRDTGNTIIRAIDIYNPFVNEDRFDDSWPEDQGYDLQVIKSYLGELNDYLCKSAEMNAIPCARVYNEFNGQNGEMDPEDKGWIFYDEIHANGEGHKRISELLDRLGYYPIIGVNTAQK